MPAKASAPRRRQHTPAPSTKPRGAKPQSKRSRKGGAPTSPPAGLLCSKANPVNHITLAKTPSLAQLECPGCGGHGIWRNDGKEKTWFGCAGACNQLARELVNNREPEDTRTYSSTFASRDKKIKLFESWVPSAVRASASAASSPVKRTAAAVQPDATTGDAPVAHKTSRGDGDGDSGDSHTEGDRDGDGGDSGSEGDGDVAPMQGADDGEDGWTDDDDLEPPPLPRFSPDTEWFDSRRDVTISLEKLNGKKFVFNIKTVSEWFFYYSMPLQVETYMQHYRGVYALEAFDALGEREWVPFSDATRWHGVRIANDMVRLRVTHATHPLGHPEGPPPASPVNTSALAGTGAQPAAQTSQRESTSSVVDLTLSDEEDVPVPAHESDDNISFVTSPPHPPKKKRTSEKDGVPAIKPLKPTKTAAAARADGSTPKTAATAGSTPKTAPKTAAAPRAAGSTPKTAATAGSTPKTAQKTAAAPRAAGSTPKTAPNAGSTPKSGQGPAPRADKTSMKRKAAAAPELEKEKVTKKKRE